MIVTLKNLWKTYTMGENKLDALKDISLEIAEGEFVSVAGPSGSGKSTMMNSVGLIDKATHGNVVICGQETTQLDRHELARMRREQIGFIFQSFNLLPVLNVYENVELPLIISGNSASKAERKDWINHLLEQVGLADRRKHTPAELSGGQQQRVAIARSLVTHPKIVIADEPTANLDSENGEKVLALMKQINTEDKTTFIFSTHDSTIWKMANHVVFLHDGQIASETHQ
jgi:putative ABC transport system ATP-binding protein